MPRRLLLIPILLLTSALLPAQEAASVAAEKAHQEIWRRFVDEYGIVLDYTDLEGNCPRPTPEECREGKPNALAWWTATENGGMFNGAYMDAACLRWRKSGSKEDLAKARRLAEGLLRLAAAGKTKGFIARNVATDGRTPYPMGSNDQTAPWFYGLWRYLHEGLASPDERRDITTKMTEVALALEAAGWRMPCDEGAPSPYRGTFAGFGWEFAPRLLFVLKAMHELTGDARWQQHYQNALRERDAATGKGRLDVCRAGMRFEHEKRHSWTCASGVICLRGLWELEEDARLKQAYQEGLAASARLAAQSLPLHESFDVNADHKFQYDWRVLNAWWRPQKSEQEALAVAMQQVRELRRLSPRRYQEFTFVREPAYAAWLVTLCPDAEIVKPLEPALHAVIGHYDYSRLYYSQFFPVEAAWHRLSLLTNP